MTRVRTIACGLTLLVALCLVAFACSAFGASVRDAPPSAEDDPISLALIGAVD